jgi:hypothetical protein
VRNLLFHTRMLCGIEGLSVSLIRV